MVTQRVILPPLLADLLAAFPQHPTLRLNPAEPILHRGDPAEIFQNVLLADEPDGNNPAIGERDGGAEEFLEHEDTGRVMPECPMPEVSHVLFAGVEPLMQVEIFSGLATELPG